MIQGFGQNFSLYSTVNSTVSFWDSYKNIIVIGAFAAGAALATERVYHRFSPEWGVTWREHLGNQLLKASYFQGKYQEKITKAVGEFDKKTKEGNARFGDMLTEIPEKGWNLEEIKDFIERIDSIVVDQLKEIHMSGGIYGPVLKKELELPEFEADDVTKAIVWGEASSCYWNSLHSDAKEFGVGYWIERQLIMMLGDMVGASPEEVVGEVTLGGSASLYRAILCARNKKGLPPGEGVVIAPETVHASVIKAGLDYQVKVHLVPTDEHGRVYLNEYERAVKKYRSKAILLIGSAPSFATGVIDPIEKIGEFAQKWDIPYLVDGCLGGFIGQHAEDPMSHYINHKGEVVEETANLRVFEVTGVTITTVDTHKNGRSSKGSSVILFKNDDGDCDIKHGMHAIGDWSGGVYGSPSALGSKPSSMAYKPFLALLSIGRDGFIHQAAAIRSRAVMIKKFLEGKDKVEVLGHGSLNVIAFRLKGMRKGATYHFSKLMKEKGISLNNINQQGEGVHLCMTSRMAYDPSFLEKFYETFDSCLSQTEDKDWEVLCGTGSFEGDAGLYGEICPAINPALTEGSRKEKALNYFFGIQLVKDTIKSFFFNKMDQVPE